MIGVASRNAKRAASLFDSPTSRPPPIVAPEREKPGIRASACAVPTPKAPRQPTWRAIRASSSASTCTARRRRSSAPKSRKPLRIRKTAAERGEANTCRSLCSSSRPRIPAGIVPTTSSQPSFASTSSGAISRSRRLRPSPRRIRTQSRQKKPSRTIAVARCVATRKVRKYESFWWMFQPRSFGRTTLWPRLETGKSSETPWSRPRTTACQYEIRLASGIASAPRVGRLLPAGREPRVDEAREPDEEGRDAVLHVVVSGVSLVPRDPRRERAGGLYPVDDREHDQRDPDDDGERGESGVPRHRAGRYPALRRHRLQCCLAVVGGGRAGAAHAGPSRRELEDFG